MTVIRQPIFTDAGKRARGPLGRARGWCAAPVLVVLILALAALSSAHAEAAEWKPKPAQNFSQSDGISPAQAAALVRASYGGRVLSASRSSRSGSAGVVVRVLIDDGARVKTVFVDGRGRMRAAR